jgi:hypothetical protein
VRRYDHHCPWINNCVGKGNQRYFLVFICITQIDFLCTGVLSALYAFKDFDGIGLWPDPFKFVDSDIPIIAVAVSALSFVCFLVVLPLFYVTLTNAMKKITTSQRFGFKKK